MEHFQAIMNSIDMMEEDAKVISVGDFNLSSISWIDSTLGVRPVLSYPRTTITPHSLWI